jgi:signal transduction histidine kinase
MQRLEGIWPLALVASAACALMLLSRGLGFGDGLVVAATPASAVALAASVRLRARGALAAAAGFAASGVIGGIGLAAALLDAATHAIAALLAAQVMRMLARRQGFRNRVQDWLISMAGVLCFTLVLGAQLAAADRAGIVSLAGLPSPDIALALVAQPLGIMTFGGVLASLDEVDLVRAAPRPAFWTMAIAAGLLSLLWLILRADLPGIRPPGATLLLSLPFCLWVAMQPRSLDGAAISFLAAYLAVGMVRDATGGLSDADFIVTLFYLALLVAACQLVHAVNRDRLDALAEVEAQKRLLEARVAERTAVLAAATAAAEAANEQKSRFVTVVSHEIRTPLSGILGMTNMILAEESDPARRRRLEIIRKSGLHLLDVINRVLDFAQMGRGFPEGTEEDFDLGRLVEEVVDEARALPHAGDVPVRIEIAPALPLVRHGNRHAIRLVLTNLIANALKFTRQGTVTLRLTAGDRDGLRIEVADTGIGIDPAMRERIFEPFVQGREAARFGGTGLGLAICRDIVARLGGTIVVRDNPGGGSVFCVDLPLPVPPAGDDPAALDRAPGTDGDEGGDPGRRTGPPA